MKSNLVDLELMVLWKTEKALQVKDTEDADPVWLPLSQIEYEVQPSGVTAMVTLPEWLALERGLI